MNIQQPGHEKLPDQLECYHAFGSLVIAIPDEQRRAGCHGPRICWLNPGEETYGLHAEGAAVTRQDDADEILTRWESLTQSLRGVAGGNVTRGAAMDLVANLEQFIQTRGVPCAGFRELFVKARAAASVDGEPTKVMAHDEVVNADAERRSIKHGRTENTISGPYFVLFMRGNRVSSSVTGIQTPARCQETAEEYSRLYDAPIVTPRIETAPPVCAAP